jgi:hypothetical protein
MVLDEQAESLIELVNGYLSVTIYETGYENMSQCESESTS